MVCSAHAPTDVGFLGPKVCTHSPKLWPPSCEMHTTGTSAVKSWYATYTFRPFAVSHGRSSSGAVVVPASNDFPWFVEICTDAWDTSRSVARRLLFLLTATSSSSPRAGPLRSKGTGLENVRPWLYECHSSGPFRSPMAPT